VVHLGQERSAGTPWAAVAVRAAAVLWVVVAGVRESRRLRCATAMETGAKRSRGRGGTYRRLVVARAAAQGGRRRAQGGGSWRSSRIGYWRIAPGLLIHEIGPHESCGGVSGVREARCTPAARI